MKRTAQLIQPMHDRVLVRAEQPPEKVGRIFLPETLQTNKTSATADINAIKAVVIAVGPGKRDEDGWRVPTSYKPGDKVWVSSRWNDLPAYSETERLIQEADILGMRGT